MPLAAPTWTTLTAGLVGSVIAVFGAVGVAMLTIALDRRSRRRADEALAVKEDFAARRNVATAARAVHRALESEMRWRPFLHDKVKLALVDSLMVAVTESGRDHPAVTRWMLSRWDAIDELERRWVRSLWRQPLASTRFGAEWGAAIGELSATLAEWAAGLIDDDWFDKQVEQALGTPTPWSVSAVESPGYRR